MWRPWNNPKRRPHPQEQPPSWVSRCCTEAAGCRKLQELGLWLCCVHRGQCLALPVTFSGLGQRRPPEPPSPHDLATWGYAVQSVLRLVVIWEPWLGSGNESTHLWVPLLVILGPFHSVPAAFRRQDSPPFYPVRGEMQGTCNKK